MLKSGSPIAVMVASFAFGLKQPNVRLVSIILTICAGVGIASYGAADYHPLGFAIQGIAICIVRDNSFANSCLLIRCGFEGSSSTSTDTNIATWRRLDSSRVSIRICASMYALSSYYFYSRII